MADGLCAENLEDGELWLPSDFFSMDEAQVSNKNSSLFGCCASSKPSCMEGFKSICSSTFVQRHPHNRGLCKPLPTSQRFNPAVRYGFSGVPGRGAHDPCNCGTGKSWTGCSSIYQLQRLDPVQEQVETFMAERARALQRQQQNRYYLSRVFPRVRIAAHGGTGVFLPRISSDMVTVTKNHNPHFVGKEPRTNNWHEFRRLPPRKMLLLNRRQQEYSGYAHEVMPNNSKNH